MSETFDTLPAFGRQRPCDRCDAALSRVRDLETAQESLLTLLRLEPGQSVTLDGLFCVAGGRWIAIQEAAAALAAATQEAAGAGEAHVLTIERPPGVNPGWRDWQAICSCGTRLIQSPQADTAVEQGGRHIYHLIPNLDWIKPDDYLNIALAHMNDQDVATVEAERARRSAASAPPAPRDGEQEADG